MTLEELIFASRHDAVFDRIVAPPDGDHENRRV